jgi:hypothetical protein
MEQAQADPPVVRKARSRKAGMGVNGQQVTFFVDDQLAAAMRSKLVGGGFIAPINLRTVPPL